ncbi:Inherit from COG: Na H antiporter [Seminavis robusta]|uniref:Inherit from COG: Na H antiporter n=1 Tax=Seminavis robusta TaxID=568900 RepID=A0A9N8DRY7_9STRA|nr:Inherit from COG: Na H antiporter [Seminavis robusta]|eukprot:Sro298_g111170.1 Inherit from COG: Na H antiporter (801) ;mRNA; r:55002-57499
MISKTVISCLVAISALSGVSAFDYSIKDAGKIGLTDVNTQIDGLKTLFVGAETFVTVSNLEWEESNNTNTGYDKLFWETSVGGIVQSKGSFDLSTLSNRELPDSLDVGTIKVESAGRHKISVTLSVDDSEESTSSEYEAYQAGAAIVPLIIVMVLAFMTQMVEVSLFSAVFVGACMVAGNLREGFKSTLDEYILKALANEDHAYVYLFTLFLSGMVGMMEKSGGMYGFTKSIAKYAKTARAGQVATFAIGCCVFFDDYANTLLAGETMRPLTDLLFISREKLSFLVDATAAPIASISPISSWVGTEIGLIDNEIEKLIKLYGEDNLTIETSAFAVFLESIKYRYYPIFMLLLMPMLIYSQRDLGPMLIAERKTQVYQRIDGGDGKGPSSKNQEGGAKKENQPRPDTPQKPWNMALPVVFLVVLIFYFLVKTGEDPTEERSFMEKIENSNSYSSLLWGTMAATMLTFLLYQIQFVQKGKLVLPTWPVIKSMFGRSKKQDQLCKEGHAELTENEDHSHSECAEDAAFIPSSKARTLVSIFECVEAFLYGMARIFPALIVLTLAWASGAIMLAVGADRLFSQWITQGISPEAMPTVSFVISIFMALATGTSWGTMSILFPLICVPTYQVSNGDATIFYATVAGILSGSVAGDHVSPISDTTVLSALASDCQLLGHVTTQAPYAIIVTILSILFGTLPIGNHAMPNIVGILLGAVSIVLIVYFLCVPVLSETGRFDIFTQLWIRLKRDTSLQQLQEDTVKRHNGSMETMVSNKSDEANGDEEDIVAVNCEEVKHVPGRLSEVSV